MEYDIAYKQADNLARSFKPAVRQKLAQETAKKWRSYTDGIQELIKDSQEAWDFYLRNHPTAKTMSNRGQRQDKFDVESTKKKGLRLGSIPKAVDSILSLIHNTLFPIDDRFFRGTPCNPEAQEAQEPVESFLAENFGEANISTEMRAFFHNVLLDGTACAFVPYRRKEVEKIVYERPMLAMGPMSMPIPWAKVQEVKKTVLEWEGTRFEPLDFNDWRVDPCARSLADSCFLRRWYKPVEAVKAEFPWVKEVEAYRDKDSHDAQDTTYKHQSAGINELISSIDGEEDEGYEKALLMIEYGDFYVDGKSYKNHMAVVLNDKELVYFGPNPYNHQRIPYIVAPYNPIPGQIYGMSAVKHAIPSAEYIDRSANLILKNAAWSIPILLKNMKDAAVRKHGNIEIKPGMTLPVENFNAYQQLQINLSSLTILENLIQKCEENIQEVTGANPFIAGEAPTPGDTTAFEVDQRVQGGNSRFQSIMTNLANLVLEPFMFIAFENFKQYKSKDETVGTFTIRPDDLKLMEFKWVTMASQATISRNRRIANKKAILTELMPALVAQGIVKLKPVGLEFDHATTLRSFLIESGELDADKILKIMPLDPMAAMGPVPPEGDAALNGGVMNGQYPSVPPTPNVGASGSPGTNYAASA